MEGQNTQSELQLEDQLLQENSGLYTGDGTVDGQGKPVLKNKTGRWRACSFILGTEFSERLAYYGISTNLISYLTSRLHESNISAAKSVSTWQGTSFFTPLIGAYIADSYWGRYRTIAVFSFIYLIGMCTLTLSVSVPALKPAECLDSICPPVAPPQYAIFFSSLYLIALGVGGIKPCVSSFGADQFDDTDPRERLAKGSFFNWFYFSIHMGVLLSDSLIVWIQENVGWGLGFGICTLFVTIAVANFLFGTPLYRFQRPGGSPLTRVFQVVVASLHKWKLEIPLDSSSLLYEAPDEHYAVEGSRKLMHTDGLKFLDKSTILSDIEQETQDFSNQWRLCTVTQVEELKVLIRIFPIWATSIAFTIVATQMSTTFVEQGKAMDRTIGSFTIPAASLSTSYIITSLFCVSVYDKVLVPIVREFTGKERGLSELQRMGIGLFISILAMVAAALVEVKRLQLANELDSVDEIVVVPLNILWQIPQYALVGIADVFIYVGNLEFFYNQSPDGMRSLCAAFVPLLTSVGSYINSLILTIVTAITTTGGKAGWIPDNINKGHLDHFFWLVALLSFLNLLLYILCAMKYKPKNSL